MRIIPAIDIIDGKCVRLYKGNYQHIRWYNENPFEVALQFEDTGFSYLHLVDLDGARTGKVVHYKILEKIASHTSLHIDFSGGISNDDMLRIVFECGAAQATVGSIAAKEPDTVFRWIKKYGSDKIVLAADVQNEKILISGWQQATSLFVYDFISRFVEENIQYVMCTDTARDGTLQGPSITLYKKIKEHFKEIHLIASGGIGHVSHIEQCFSAGCEAVIVGSALYEGKIALHELSKLAS